MKVLIACEFSGIVRDAFAAKGHDAWSCDLLPSESPGNHYQCDVWQLVGAHQNTSDWDLMIAHPPCTYLAVSGARWWKDREKEQQAAIAFAVMLYDAAIPKVCLENPVGKLSTAWCKPDQYIQPWQFGHGEVKKTGLWLKGLPKLEPTDVVNGREPRVHYASPGPDRWKERSRFYPGIAQAMAEQWG